MTAHITGVNGLRNDQALEFNFLTGATTTSPDSMYGCVKSAILVRFVIIAMSPIAASYTCKVVENQRIRKLKELQKLINKVLFAILTPVVIKRTSSV